MYKYKRIDEIVAKKEINDWLEKIVDGGRIIYYLEFPAHTDELIRVQMIVENTKETKKTKKSLFS